MTQLFVTFEHFQNWNYDYSHRELQPLKWSYWWCHSLMMSLLSQVHVVSRVSFDAERAERLRRPAWGHRREHDVTNHHRAHAIHAGAQNGEEIGEWQAAQVKVMTSYRGKHVHCWIKMLSDTYISRDKTQAWSVFVWCLFLGHTVMRSTNMYSVGVGKVLFWI